MFAFVDLLVDRFAFRIGVYGITGPRISVEVPGVYALITEATVPEVYALIEKRIVVVTRHDKVSRTVTKFPLEFRAEEELMLSPA